MNKKSIFIEKGTLRGEKKAILYNGLLTNKNVNISENKDLCDYIFIDFREFKKAKSYKKEHLEKLVIIDYRDGANDVFSLPCLKYFKRSVVDKKHSVPTQLEFTNYNREIIPISYCLKQEVLEFKNIYEYDRYIDISIFFKPDQKSYRSRIATFIKNNFNNYNIFVGICGNDGEVGRSSIQMDYYKKMFHSKIVVTCNHDNWEGDYRTWEALSTGALIFVDIMKTPITNPLINEKHVIFYDKNDPLKLKEKILFYLKNPDLAKNISQEGNRYALKYHKPCDRIDEILSVL
jgi:hypothetical protein